MTNSPDARSTPRERTLRSPSTPWVRSGAQKLSGAARTYHGALRRHTAPTYDDALAASPRRGDGYRAHGHDAHAIHRARPVLGVEVMGFEPTASTLRT